ncbi:cytochrome c oxidase assembly protein (plasmid) [Ensifer adhaerens]|uniref:cytochrome c oxidase assembly protein n=1 Tax=Ensifer adhaerens TaxID=106592 RepID=UPI001CBDF33B|nr:cytochrome c oxidase assembly protein [Ensifer adhaerens]MBZ7927238.1 cytochrome c oxidase assembly protein [Ensifer adhaerens]UAX98261.1 cytochrome c oxidase assembly protein [Ensifer adhaerens]UAY05643.1 cytochrome c oxidase assembly protein [Ensifer adhaerens]UAY13021.1 cytochrome c oxidase assembly protein [Ensifer adhaerens]
MSALIGLFTILMTASPAIAHGGEAHSGPQWTFDPWISLPLAIISLLYGLGLIKVWRRARRVGPIAQRILLFYAGVLSLAGALLSPLHWLGEHLFAFHMIEHEIVMVVSAPLMVIARPMGFLLWALPRRTRHLAGRAIHSPAMSKAWEWSTRTTNATILHGIAIWAWHVPTLFDAAFLSPHIHRLQHISFFATAILFWWALVWKSGHGVAGWHLFVTMMHTNILGALMALAPRAVYFAQTNTTLSWGLTPLQDQQLAGMIMWVPAGTVYAAACLTMFALWIYRSGRIGEQNV